MKKMILGFVVCLMMLFTTSAFAYTGLLNKDVTVVALNAYETTPSAWVTWDGLGRDTKYNITTGENKNSIYAVILTAISSNKTVKLYLENDVITGAVIGQ